MKRRTFLKMGTGSLALPFLEGDGWSNEDIPPFLFVCRQANGVTQADGAEPDRFWPTQTGAIDGELYIFPTYQDGTPSLKAEDYSEAKCKTQTSFNGQR